MKAFRNRGRRLSCGGPSLRVIRVERKEWMKMSINHEINRLIHFAVQKNLMKEEDRYYAANRLLDVLKVAEFTPEDDIEETLPTATPVLKEMLDYAAGKGQIGRAHD